MRLISEPFVVARPAGARVRTRLRLTAADQAVVRAVGEHLGRLAGADVAWRCRLGRGGEQRAVRKRTLTSQSSSRWAGSITRTSNDQWRRALANLADRRIALRRASRAIGSRLAVPVGQARGCGRGRVRGCATRAERFAKQGRLQHLQAQLAEVEGRLAAGRVSVCRGGRRLAKLRHTLEDAKLTSEQWRAGWQAERLFLTADGDAEYPLGNGTIVVHPERRWCEIRLPAPLAYLADRPGGRYRLACPVVFTHRGDEWAAQAATGAVRYDVEFDPLKKRWYLHASWRIPVVTPPAEELRRQRAVGVDLNADHLDAWVLDEGGNPVGLPHTIPLDLDGQPASTRDGRLRAAIMLLLRLATERGCRSTWWRTWTSPTPARPAERRWDAAGAARNSAGWSRGSRPAGSAPCWSAWLPTTGCGSSRWIPAGRRCGGGATGRHRSTSRPRRRSSSPAIMPRRW